MQGQYLQHGATNPRVHVTFLVPSTGFGQTSLTHSTAGLTLAYRRSNASPVPILLAAGSLTTGWVSGGFVHVGGGVYQLDLPTAAAVSGVDSLVLVATGLPSDTMMVPCVVPMGPDNIAVSAADAVWSVSTREVTALSSTIRGQISDSVWGASVRELTTISAAIREAIADSFIGRAAAGGANGGRTVGLALQKLLNKWLRSGIGNTTLTHYAANDATPLITETLTLDETGAVIGGDPT